MEEVTLALDRAQERRDAHLLALEDGRVETDEEGPASTADGEPVEACETTGAVMTPDAEEEQAAPTSTALVRYRADPMASMQSAHDAGLLTQDKLDGRFPFKFADGSHMEYMRKGTPYLVHAGREKYMVNGQEVLRVVRELYPRKTGFVVVSGLSLPFLFISSHFVIGAPRLRALSHNLPRYSLGLHGSVRQ